MSTYLLCAHQTASSPELMLELKNFIDANPLAKFVLLVPATSVQHLEGAREGDNWQIAKEVAMEAKADLQQAGIPVLDAFVGDPSPLTAIEDELRRDRRIKYNYGGIIVSTFPPGVSRWLNLDLPSRAARRFDLPVHHIVSRQRALATY